MVFVGRAKEALEERPDRFMPLVRYAMLTSHTTAPVQINCFHRSFIDISCLIIRYARALSATFTRSGVNGT